MDKIGGEMSFYEFLLNLYYVLVRFVKSDLFKIFGIGGLGFVTVIGCIYIIRYIVTLRR